MSAPVVGWVLRRSTQLQACRSGAWHSGSTDAVPPWRGGLVLVPWPGNREVVVAGDALVDRVGGP